jgi:hypothetical protein
MMMGRPRNEDRPTSLNRSERPKRVPINGLRDKLTVVGQEEGWHYCWVNEDKVPRFTAANYEFVTHECVIGDRKVDNNTAIGGKHSMNVGNGVTAYLMRCPQEEFDEDRATELAEIKAREDAMKRELNSSSDGRYGKVEIAQNKPARR